MTREPTFEELIVFLERLGERAKGLKRRIDERPELRSVDQEWDRFLTLLARPPQTQLLRKAFYCGAATYAEGLNAILTKGVSRPEAQEWLLTCWREITQFVEEARNAERRRGGSNDPPVKTEDEVLPDSGKTP